MKCPAMMISVAALLVVVGGCASTDSEETEWIMGMRESVEKHIAGDWRDLDVYLLWHPSCSEALPGGVVVVDRRDCPKSRALSIDIVNENEVWVGTIDTPHEAQTFVPFRNCIVVAYMGEDGELVWVRSYPFDMQAPKRASLFDPIRQGEHGYPQRKGDQPRGLPYPAGVDLEIVWYAHDALSDATITQFLGARRIKVQRE